MPTWDAIAAWRQALPESPDPDDTNAVLLWGMTLLVIALGWVVRRYVTRIEKREDEMTPLLRQMTDLLKAVADDSARRDENMAQLVRELAARIKEMERRVEAGARRRE